MKKFLTVEELSEKLKPLFGKKIDQLYFRYMTSNSQDEKLEILQILTSLYQKYLSNLLEDKILLEPPPKELLEGEYPLGNVLYNEKELYSFNLREVDWPRHVCITGMSGSGKTNIALNILKNFSKKGKPFLVFDWKKSFRSLIKMDPEAMLFTVGSESVSNAFKININKPPKGVRPKEWITILCDILTESFSVSFGVHKVLLETLDEIFEKWGIYEGFNHYPNWEHVKKMIESKAKDAKKRESTWYESAMRIASVLTFGDFGNVINYEGKKSLSIEDLFDKKVVLELNSLGTIEKKFFCEYILTYIYKLKKANEEKNEKKFDYAILVDEAHNIFLKNKANFMTESVTDMVYREMREYGTSLICLDQHISKLSDTVKGNSACHIAFQQQLPEDIRDISDLMQLSAKKEMFSKIPVGFSIVKLAERYTSPFLIKVPLFDSDSKMYKVEDDRIKSRMDFNIREIEIEKDDQEFKEALMKGVKEEKKQVRSSQGKTPKSIKKSEIPSKNKDEIPKKDPFEEALKGLTPIQKELFLFIIKKLEEGRELKDIEKLLEGGLSEGLYTFSDVLTAINSAMEERLNLKREDKKIPFSSSQEQIKEKEKVSVFSEDERKFIDFLINNPNHEYNTVELYKIMGFSTRKGNIIKKKLLEKNLIYVQEERSKKGWQKFIRLA
jgi:hypothetical protein